MDKLRDKIILSLLSVILFYSLVEISLRITNVNFNIPKYFQFSPNLLIDPQLAKGTMLKDPVLFWRLAPDKTRKINSKGMRDNEFSIEKPKEVFRIICLGDSVTFGWPNKSEKAYAYRLEALLNERIKNCNFEVINAGVPGYSFLSRIEIFRNGYCRISTRFSHYSFWSQRQGTCNTF